MSNRPRIVKNSIRCNHCLEIIESIDNHDYIKCACGKVGVDGGLQYLRRVGSPEDYEELSVISEQ